MEIIESKVMTDNTLAIIQARIGSTRLPGKVLMPLADKKVLEHVITRVEESKAVSEVMVATSTREDDNVIAEFCEKLNVHTFRGSEDDVLDRFYQASRLLKPAHVVRITADCPMIDPGIISEILIQFQPQPILHFRHAPRFGAGLRLGFFDRGLGFGADYWHALCHMRGNNTRRQSA